MDDNSHEEPLMSFVISFSLVGNDEWALTVTRVDADGIKPASRFADSQSMLDFIQKHLAEKSAIPLPMQRSVS
jgi:hypothetical protein